MSAAPVVLARLAGCPLLPAWCVRDSSGSYVATVEPPVNVEGRTDVEVMSDVAATLDRVIAGVPDQWYPFNPVWVDDAIPETATRP